VFIIINWTVWGLWGGVIAYLITLLVALYNSLAASDGSYLLVVLPAFLLGLSLYNRQQRVKVAVTAHNLRLEHVERDYNLLLQDYSKQQHLKESYHKKTERFSYLSEVVKEAAFSLASKEINKQIVNNLMRSIDTGDVYYLWEIGADLQSLQLQVLESSRGITLTDSVQSDEFNLWTMRHRQPLLVTDLAKDYRFNTQQIMAGTKTRSLIVAPLTTADKMMGIIRVDSFQANTFTLDDLRLLAIIANIAALTIYNADLFKQTEHLANRDGLTELYVRRYFDEALEQVVAEARLSGGSFSVLLLDLDSFKELNDTYGHSVGDKVLQKVAQLIEDELSQASPGTVTKPVAARYGGEEFIVLLPNIARQGARDIAESIRRAVGESNFSIRREGVRATISIGIAEYPRNGEQGIKIIECADRALYQAKREGRNRVVVAEI